VVISAAEATDSEPAREWEPFDLIDETEPRLRELGLRVERHGSVRHQTPITECTPEDRLVGLQVKAVIDSPLRRFCLLKGEQREVGVKRVINTLLRRYGLLKGELPHKAYIRLVTGEAQATSPGKLTLYF